MAFPSFPKLVLLFAILTFSSSCGPHHKRPHPVPSDYSVHGVDVSKYQGVIDWSRVKKSGVHFAWVKATEGGDHKDEAFERNWHGAKDAGVLRGAYHFIYWCRPAHQQVDWFKTHVPPDPEALPPVLDLEWVHNSKTCPGKIPAEVAHMTIRDILDGLEQAYGKKPVIYTTVDFYHDVLKHGNFSNYPMWVRSVASHPQVRYGNQDWHFWQYTAQGKVPGIGAPVDKNVFQGSLQDLYALAE